MKSVALALIFSMAFVVNGCAHNFPDIHPHVILPKKQLCGEYTVIRKDPWTVSERPTKWKNILDCNGYFAFPPEDAAKVRAWYDTERAAREKQIEQLNQELP